MFHPNVSKPMHDDLGRSTLDLRSSSVGQVAYQLVLRSGTNTMRSRDVPTLFNRELSAEKLLVISGDPI